jgi:hypothetical protein
MTSASSSSCSIKEMKKSAVYTLRRVRLAVSGQVGDEYGKVLAQEFEHRPEAVAGIRSFHGPAPHAGQP